MQGRWLSRTTRVEWQSPKENIIPAKHSSLDGFPFSPRRSPTPKPPPTYTTGGGGGDEGGGKKRVAHARTHTLTYTRTRTHTNTDTHRTKPEGDNTKPFHPGNDTTAVYIVAVGVFIIYIIIPRVLYINGLFVVIPVPSPLHTHYILKIKTVVKPYTPPTPSGSN